MHNLVLEKIHDKNTPFIKKTLKENYLVYEDIKNKNIELFSAYINQTLVGIIGLEELDNIGLLRSLVVFEEYRNKGYGREICKSLLAYAKDKKIKELYLLTTNAEKFFEQIDFETISRKNVPDPIKNTRQFSHLCPNSAKCMKIVS